MGGDIDGALNSPSSVVLSGEGSLARHAREARERNPEKPSGLERSREWALRINLTASVDSSAKVGRSDWQLSSSPKVKKWAKVPRPSFGVVQGFLEIQDRTTGATGLFPYAGIDIAVDLPASLEWRSGWKTFQTVEQVTLRSFEDIVRFASLNLGFYQFETIQFTSVNVDQDSFADDIRYGDGVDTRTSPPASTSTSSVGAPPSSRSGAPTGANSTRRRSRRWARRTWPRCSSRHGAISTTS